MSDKQRKSKLEPIGKVVKSLLLDLYNSEQKLELQKYIAVQTAKEQQNGRVQSRTKHRNSGKETQ